MSSPPRIPRRPPAAPSRQSFPFPTSRSYQPHQSRPNPHRSKSHSHARAHQDHNSAFRNVAPSSHRRHSYSGVEHPPPPPPPQRRSSAVYPPPQISTRVSPTCRGHGLYQDLLRIEGGDALFKRLETCAEDFEAARYTPREVPVEKMFQNAAQRLADVFIKCLNFELKELKEERQEQLLRYEREEAAREREREVQGRRRRRERSPSYRRAVSDVGAVRGERSRLQGRKRGLVGHDVRKRRKIARHVQELTSEEEDNPPPRRSLRVRPPVTFVNLDEDEDEDEVVEFEEPHRRASHPRRAKENMHSLNDDLAYDQMLKQNHQRALEAQRLLQEKEKEKVEADAVSVVDSSEESDDEDKVPVIRPKLVTHPLSLRSDFASATPIISDDDDSTDCEQRRHYAARHPVSLTPKLDGGESQVFPLATRRRMRADFLVTNFSQISSSVSGETEREASTTRVEPSRFTIVKLPYLSNDDIRTNFVGLSKTLWPTVYHEREEQREKVAEAKASSASNSTSEDDAGKAKANGNGERELVPLGMVQSLPWRVQQPHGMSSIDVEELIAKAKNAEDDKEAGIEAANTDDKATESATGENSKLAKNNDSQNRAGEQQQGQKLQPTSNRGNVGKNLQRTGDAMLIDTKRPPIDDAKAVIIVDSDENDVPDSRVLLAGKNSVQMLGNSQAGATAQARKPSLSNMQVTPIASEASKAGGAPRVDVATAQGYKPALHSSAKSTANVSKSGNLLQPKPTKKKKPTTTATGRPRLPSFSAAMKRPSGGITKKSWQFGSGNKPKVDDKPTKSLPSPLSRARSKALPVPLRRVSTLPMPQPAPEVGRQFTPPAQHRMPMGGVSPPVHAIPAAAAAAAAAAHTASPTASGQVRYATPELNITMGVKDEHVGQASANYGRMQLATAGTTSGHVGAMAEPHQVVGHALQPMLPDGTANTWGFENAHVSIPYNAAGMQMMGAGNGSSANGMALMMGNGGIVGGANGMMQQPQQQYGMSVELMNQMQVMMASGAGGMLQGAVDSGQMAAGVAHGNGGSSSAAEAYNRKYEETYNALYEDTKRKLREKKKREQNA